MPENQEKVCVICGASCAGQPRIKNEQGQYAHQACAEKRTSKPAAHPVTPDPMLGDDEDLMGALLDDLPGAAEPALAAGPGAGGLKQGCPGCGVAVSPEAVVCTGCGFNFKTGKGLKTKISKEPKANGASSMAGTAGEFAAAGTKFLAGALIGGAAAAAVGAGVWSAIIIGTGYEIRALAIGVGALCGFGTAVGSRGQSGMMTGCIAVVFAVLAIIAGKYAAVVHITDEMYGVSSDRSMYIDTLGPDEIDGYMVRGLVIDRMIGDISAERVPARTRERYEKAMTDGEYPDDYPKDLIAAAQAEWDGHPESRRMELIEAQRDSEREFRQVMRSAVRESGLMALLMRPRSLIFFVVAIVAAYYIGSGGNE